MFLMIGVRDQQRQLNFTQTILCQACGSYGRYEVFMVCSVFTLFFIPLIRFNRRYYVRTTCYGYGQRTVKRCSNCGYTTTEDFEYCPKCGRRF